MASGDSCSGTCSCSVGFPFPFMTILYARRRRRGPPSTRLFASGGLTAGLQGSAQQLGGDVDDRNDSLIGHPRRTDDTEDAHRIVLGGIRGRDDTIRIEELVSGLMA